MKKRSTTKRPAKVSATKKVNGSAKKPAPKPLMGSTTVKVTAYTPAPLKSDGWPPFRYPLQ